MTATEMDSRKPDGRSVLVERYKAVCAELREHGAVVKESSDDTLSVLSEKYLTAKIAFEERRLRALLER